MDKKNEDKLYGEYLAELDYLILSATYNSRYKKYSGGIAFKIKQFVRKWQGCIES